MKVISNLLLDFLAALALWFYLNSGDVAVWHGMGHATDTQRFPPQARVDPYFQNFAFPEVCQRGGCSPTDCPALWQPTLPSDRDFWILIFRVTISLNWEWGHWIQRLEVETFWRPRRCRFSAKMMAVFTASNFADRHLLPSGVLERLLFHTLPLLRASSTCCWREMYSSPWTYLR